MDKPGCPGEVPEPEGDVLCLLDGAVGPLHGAVGVGMVEHVEDLLMPVDQGLVGLLELLETGGFYCRLEVGKHLEVGLAVLAAEEPQRHLLGLVGRPKGRIAREDFLQLRLSPVVQGVLCIGEDLPVAAGPLLILLRQGDPGP